MPEPAEKLIQILTEARTIAIVGLSTAKAKAERAGLRVVTDTCIMASHKFLMRKDD